MELIFAIFSKYPVHMYSIDNIFVFVKNVQQKYIFSNGTLYGMRTL